MHVHIGFTIAAVVMTVLGVVALRSARRSSRRTGRVAGAWSTVVGHTTATDATHRWSVRSRDFWTGGGVPFTVPVVRWVGPDGRERRGVPRNPRAFSRQVPLGGRLALQFDTADPDWSSVAGRTRDAGALTALGALFIALGVAFGIADLAVAAYALL